MIVRIHTPGKSFAGTAAYLSHDTHRAQTDDRVAWTHTHNLANDHVPSAVDEMYWTARDAELLKQEAGIRAGGRATENTVKHLSLNWSPEDKPTREHMIETTREFLRHMKWEDHQAILFSHTDKPYAHVHAMLNMVHPETGLRLDDNFERRRAQAWALEYEREQGRIYCEQRLKNASEREDALTRPAWLAFQEHLRHFECAENILENQNSFFGDGEYSKNNHNAEWKILKEVQRTERKAFFTEGKSEFSSLRNSIFREIRGEFRDRWANFYAASRGGGDPDTLASLKATLIADQKVVLEARRDEACKDLRESRDGLYRDLLDGQRDARLDLRTRQATGLDNTAFLEGLNVRESTQDIRTAFREAAETTTRPETKEVRGEFGARDGAHEHAEAGAGAGMDGPAMGLRVCSVLDSLLSVFEGPRPDPRPPKAERDLLQAAADDTLKREQRERIEAENEREKRQRSPCE